MEFGIIILWTKDVTLGFFRPRLRPFPQFLIADPGMMIWCDSLGPRMLPSFHCEVGCSDRMTLSRDFRSQPSLLLRPLNAALLFLEGEVLVRKLDRLHEPVIMLNK